MDLFNLHLNTKIAIDVNGKKADFKSVIRFINEYANIKDKIAELIILNSDDDKEKAQELLKIAMDNNVEAILEKKQSAHLKPAVEKPGFIPTYMLEAGSQYDNECLFPIDLICETHAGRKSDPEKVGFIDFSGLKLPPYYLYYIYKRMGNYLVQKANDYFVATNETKSDIQFLFFNYNDEYDEFAKKSFATESFCKSDRAETIKYNVDYKINIDGLDGFYAIKKFRLHGEDFNSRYNTGVNLSKLSKDTMDIFNESLGFSKSVSFIKSSGNYAFAFSLAPFEIVLISIEHF
jgi:hypothetical protein